MATIRDVAKLSGVSVATVSRVINKNGYVHARTEESVLAAMKALNYRPNEVARSLAGKGTSTIALMVPDIANPFFPELAKSIGRVAGEYGYSIMLCDADNDPGKEKQYLEVLRNKRIDGLIIASYTIQPTQIRELQSQGIPVVVVDNRFPGEPILSLAADNREGAKAAARHLLARGCRKIAHISGTYQVAAAMQRSLGYEEACRDLPWFVPSLIAQGDFHADGGYAAMLELLERHPDLDGVFAGNDLMAIGALKALHGKGIRVPGDIKLIGFDGIAAGLVVPELSTMAQPIGKMGAMAMEFLIKLMNGEQVALKTHELEVELAEGQTTA